MRHSLEGVTFLQNTATGAMLEQLRNAPGDVKATLVMSVDDDFTLMRTDACRSSDMLVHGELISTLAREDLFGGAEVE